MGKRKRAAPDPQAARFIPTPQAFPQEKQRKAGVKS